MRSKSFSAMKTVADRRHHPHRRRDALSGLAALPNEEEYETLAGFLMVMLRRVPRRTDRVDWGGYRFEVMDVDSYRIDQVLVTRMQEGEAVVPHQQPHPASTLSAVAAVAATGPAAHAASAPAPEAQGMAASAEPAA